MSVNFLFSKEGLMAEWQLKKIMPIYFSLPELLFTRVLTEVGK
jgi:hypothetical protein